MSRPSAWCRLLALAALGVGCSSPPSVDGGGLDGGAETSATGSGTGDFAAFDLASSGAFFLSSSGSESVLISSAPELCLSLGEQRRETPGSWTLAIFFMVRPHGASVPPGAYPVNGEWTTAGDVSVAVDAFVKRADSMCNDTLGIHVSDVPTGEVELLERDPVGLRGRLDISWGDGGVVGEFDAVRCLMHSSPETCGR
ncbi:MAG: hypothetical protein VYE22_26100 [Myxococcota bacterium]|nr:hypothetical protein [Myxococcota bacterium]